MPILPAFQPPVIILHAEAEHGKNGWEVCPDGEEEVDNERKEGGRARTQRMQCKGILLQHGNSDHGQCQEKPSAQAAQIDEYEAKLDKYLKERFLLRHMKSHFNDRP